MYKYTTEQFINFCKAATLVFDASVEHMNENLYYDLDFVCVDFTHTPAMLSCITGPVGLSTQFVPDQPVPKDIFFIQKDVVKRLSHLVKPEHRLSIGNGKLQVTDAFCLVKEIPLRQDVNYYSLDKTAEYFTSNYYHCTMGFSTKWFGLINAIFGETFEGYVRLHISSNGRVLRVTQKENPLTLYIASVGA